MLKRIHELGRELAAMPELAFVQKLTTRYKNAKVYAVGGLVRDRALGRAGKDIDLVVAGVGPRELLDILFAHGKADFDRAPNKDLSTLSKKETERLILKNFGTLKYSPADSDVQIDIAYPRADDYSKAGQAGISGIKRDVATRVSPEMKIEDDLSRRDFTINAMAVEITSGELIDPFGGIDDLISRKLKAVGSPDDRIIKEDRTRGLRGIRLACQLDFAIEEKTGEAIAKIFEADDLDSVENNLTIVQKALNRINEIKHMKAGTAAKYKKMNEAVRPIFDPTGLPSIKIKHHRLRKISDFLGRYQGKIKVDPSVKPTVDQIRRYFRFIAEEERESYYDERINKLKILLDDIKKCEDVDPTTDNLVRNIESALTCPSAEFIVPHLKLIEQNIKRLVRDIRSDFPVLDNKRLPRFLQIYLNREQGGKPRRAVSKNLMRDEVFKALYASPRRAIELYDRFGGLEYVLPEVANLKDVKQSPKYHSEGDVFTHTILTLDNLPPDVSLRLKLAALLHDIGKKETFRKNTDGGISFTKHAPRGAETAERIFQRLPADKELRDGTLWLITNHLFPVKYDSKTRDKVIEEKFALNEELGNELLVLAEADLMASKPAKGAPNLKNIAILRDRIKEVRQQFTARQEAEQNLKPPLINGNDLQERLGIEPGPGIRLILARLREAQKNGEINDKEEALELAEKILAGA